MSWCDSSLTQKYLLAVNGDRANDVTRIKVMHDTAGFANVSFARVIIRYLDGDWGGAVRAKLHEGFLKMGGNHAP